MSSLLLMGLAVIAGALLVLGPVAWAVGSGMASRGALGLCAAGAVLDLAALIDGAAPTTVEVPIGLPGSGILLALDGLSALFLLLLFVAGAAASAAAMTTDSDHDPVAPLLPALLGALAATFLAADAFSVVLAFEAAALAAAALVLGGGAHGRGAARLVGGGVFAGLCLVGGTGLLAPLQQWGFDLSFDGMRAHPPTGLAATAVLVLVLLGGGAASGLAPLHRWLPRAQAATAGPTGALLAGPASSVGTYLLARLLLDIAGPAQPAWWGAVLVALGAASAVLGAAAMARAADIRSFPGIAAIANSGLVVIGVGMAQTARASDLVPLATLALGATLLLVIAHGIAGTLLALAMGAAESGAGTRRLDRLGGLLRGMPMTTLCTLVAAGSLAVLPPSIGFAAAWALFQALIASARAGGLAWQAVATVAVLATAAATTLGAVAAVRLVGIGFLGRPRTPRAAAAQDPKLPARAAMLVLALATLVAGAVPGLVLALAEPALRQLTGLGLADRAGVLAIAPMADAPGLQAAALAGLLVLLTLATLRALRFRAAIGHHAGAAWEGGAGPPPPWLPFGDPATEIGPTGFADPLAAMLEAAPPRRQILAALRQRHRAGAWAAHVLQPSARAALAVLGVVAALLLLAAVLATQA